MADETTIDELNREIDLIDLDEKNPFVIGPNVELTITLLHS
jgi:hypothetical protein